jgi:DNA-binding NarL/FixJ family response regulator
MTSRVLVVESRPVTRWGPGDPEEALELTCALHPDVVVIGLGQPDEHGLPLARHLPDRFDDLGIVIPAQPAREHAGRLPARSPVG